MASQLDCCSEQRAARLQTPLTVYRMILICVLVLTSLCHSAVCERLPLEPFGYISIDCGGEGGYNDTLTGLSWIGEKDYSEFFDELKHENLTFTSKVLINQSSSTFRNNVKQLESARIFTFLSESAKYCYNFNLSLSKDNSSAYLVRAMFPPRNIPGGPFLPRLSAEGESIGGTFAISVDTSIVSYVNMDDYEPMSVEVLATSLYDSMDICLSPIYSDEQGRMFAAISSLEVRSIPEILYPVFQHGKLNGYNRTVQRRVNYYVTQSRLNFGGNESSPAIRYPLDKYDRLWYAAPHDSWDAGAHYDSLASIKTDLKSEFTVQSMNYSTVSIASSEYDSFQVPPAILTSAWEGANLNSTISFSLEISTNDFFLNGDEGGVPRYCLSIVLFDIDVSNSGFRSVNIYNEDINSFNPQQAGRQWIILDAEVPKTRTNTWSDRTFEILSSTATTSFVIGPAANSTLPAMINALELYVVIENVAPKVTLSEFAALQILRDSLPDSRKVVSVGDPCLPFSWYWVQCSPLYSGDLSVEEINLSSEGLQVNLTEYFGLPLWLAVLDLSNNSLQGTFPRAIRDLIKLDLSDNNFIGLIPNVFDRYPDDFCPLEFINLSSNTMSGPLASFSTNLTSLRILDLSHNSFGGALPTFANRSLEVLNLSSNHLSGSINLFSDPNLVGSDSEYLTYNESGLQPLRALRLENNNFSGMIPDYIWSTESLLETVDLSNNSFTELNLTSWTESLVKEEIFNGRQQVNLSNNPIRRVLFGGLDVISNLESKNDKVMHSLLVRTPGYILLGVNNEWCNSSALSRARVLKSYLCRHNEYVDYYYWTLQQTVASSKRALTISLGVSGSVFLATACILLVFLRRMWKRTKNLRQIQEELAKEDVRPPFYKYEELRIATKDFSKENELGRGGFGAVYKAELADRTVVAVKLLYPMEQNMTDFLKETVLITGIKHRHLVQLKGCCVRDKKRILVYEFAEHGNLAQALWGNGDPSFFLDWAQRVKICVAVAKGLSYLHEELQPKIIHRDIKPYNILLDKDWNAKIADFGLARHMKGDEGTQATRFGGTVGYVSPEYANEGLITEKLDVYSYGILLLEIVSGRKCLDRSAPAEELYLRTWAFNLYRVGCLWKMAERALLESVPAEEIESVLKLALSCLQENYENRPAMSEVVIMLTGNASGVAMDIVDELREHPQVLYDNLYRGWSVSNVSGSQDKEDEDLFETALMSHSNDAEIELSVSNSDR
ncbi:hypothetical protein R1sor_016568 [Riccia sorocarpa]|uniref:non-specific serine/threonine protein kinase n=1 Tax=Riccia sorocarpa TaxID=122646 RepID=A0ABD3HLL7_9MARC